MNKARLGNLEVSTIGFGALTLARTCGPNGEISESGFVEAIHRAIDLGINFIDAAEIYGPYMSEEIVGRALRGRRENVVLTTKVGLYDHLCRKYSDDWPDLRIKKTVEGSLQRLGTDHIDLCFLHRPDSNNCIEESAETFADLIKEGKVLNFGLSAASLDSIRRAHAVQPLAALQTEYSLWARGAERETLPLLRELNIGLVPQFPIGHQLSREMTRAAENAHQYGYRKNTSLLASSSTERKLAIREVGEKVGATPAQVALAWLLRRGADIAPALEMGDVRQVEEFAAADDIVLPRELSQLLEVSETTSGLRGC